MSNASFTTAFTVDRTVDEVFAAINDVRGWWGGEIEGDTDQLGAEFTYRYNDTDHGHLMHRSTQKITELVPGRRIVWHVLDAHLSWVTDGSEWNGTDIVFDISERDRVTEVRFTHIGLVPAFECYDNCSNAWGTLVNDSLRRLITTGERQPDALATEA